MRTAIAFVLLGLLNFNSLASASRTLQQKTDCLNPPLDKIDVPGSETEVVLNGKGTLQFLCDGSVQFPGENSGTLSSPDEVWQGEYYYDAATTLATYVLQKNDGTQRIITAKNKPQVRSPSPDGAEVDWHRRVVETDTGLFANYIIRTDTTSEKKPDPGSCAPGTNVAVPWTAKFKIVSCGEDQMFESVPAPKPTPAPKPAPSPKLGPSLAQIPTGTPTMGPPVAPIVTVANTPVKAPSPAMLAAPLPAPVMAPSPSPAANVTAPAPSQNMPQVLPTAFAPAPAPAPESSGSKAAVSMLALAVCTMLAL